MKKTTIHYLSDTLCGWCFGFSPVIQRLKTEYADRLHFEMTSGGLALGERAKSVKEGFSFIRGALHRVEELAGVRFGEGYIRLLDEGSYLYDSLPPALAIASVRLLAPDKAFDVAHHIQEAFFHEGINLHDAQAYVPFIEAAGLSSETFLTLFNSEAAHTQAQSEFDWCAKLGVNGYPSLVLEYSEGLGLISNGYRSYDELKPAFDEIVDRFTG